MDKTGDGTTEAGAVADGTGAEPTEAGQAGSVGGSERGKADGGTEAGLTEAGQTGSVDGSEWGEADGGTEAGLTEAGQTGSVDGSELAGSVNAGNAAGAAKPGTTVVLADDHPHAREGMRTVVSSLPGFRVVGEAKSGEEAVELAARLRPDLILMDIHMPGMGGFEAVKAIKAAYPWVKIVMVTVSDDAAHLFEALKKGAQGYLLKNLQPSAWRDYLRAVALDEAPLRPELALSILREFGASGRSGAGNGNGNAPAAGRTGTVAKEAQQAEELTPREKEILQEVAQGRTNREVAAALTLSEHTVKNHLKNILQKLHLNNRVQLTRYAYEHGMAEPDGQ